MEMNNNYVLRTGAGATLGVELKKLSLQTGQRLTSHAWEFEEDAQLIPLKHGFSMASSSLRAQMRNLACYLVSDNGNIRLLLTTPEAFDLIRSSYTQILRSMTLTGALSFCLKDMKSSCPRFERGTLDTGLVAVSYSQDSREVIEMLGQWLQMIDELLDKAGRPDKNRISKLSSADRNNLAAIDAACAFGIGQFDPSLIRSMISLAMSRSIIERELDFAYNERYAWEELNRLARINDRDLKQARTMLSSMIGLNE